MNEDDGVMAWAYGKLTADGTLSGLIGTRVYDSIAPQNTNENFIILQEQAYTEVGTSVAGDLGCGQMMLMVKAITQSNSYASASAIIKAAHGVLQQATGASGDVTIKSCVRVNKVRFIEVQNGKRYNHVGNIYKVLVSQ